MPSVNGKIDQVVTGNSIAVHPIAYDEAEGASVQRLEPRRDIGAAHTRQGERKQTEDAYADSTGRVGAADDTADGQVRIGRANPLDDFPNRAGFVEGGDDC